jgi:hypothetical protein
MKSYRLLKKAQALTMDIPPSLCILFGLFPEEKKKAYEVPMTTGKLDTVKATCDGIQGERDSNGVNGVDIVVFSMVKIGTVQACLSLFTSTAG